MKFFINAFVIFIMVSMAILGHGRLFILLVGGVITVKIILMIIDFSRTKKLPGILKTYEEYVSREVSIFIGFIAYIGFIVFYLIYAVEYFLVLNGYQPFFYKW